MQLITLPADWQGESALYIEGAILASNMATKPLEPETWLPLVVGEQSENINAAVVERINQQYNLLKRSEYALDSLLADSVTDLAVYAEGFMVVWSMVEAHWQEAQVGDGTLRMLQALLTTFMLAVDEEGTQQAMISAGIDTPPQLADFMGQLDVMIMEVTLAADELMLGAKAQSVNPFKDIGRNDACPCGSGKKFKQCCS
ncbi:prepilin peptidase [Vibrio sp. 10N.286.49.B3]|uniref:YecA/YgfB family protein n=1 Tax=Vibrio sp. 10N.286.49.B3 TaxID=1880855 RepID=UPI000C85B61F|nr:SEC-C metal-binding domain-containing protein [Vibrio sp. 10N.286.49.B3]PMH46830.1 prepilin peptidase [Vibrio sp. 10N.286.49.B3]